MNVPRRASEAVLHLYRALQTLSTDPALQEDAVCESAVSGSSNGNQADPESYYVASDINRLVAFYRDVFGLQPKFQDGTRWAQFDIAGATLAFSDAAEGAVAPGGGAVVTLEVDNLDAVARTLETSGAEVVRPILDMGSHGRTMAFRDPEGNVVQLYQRAIATASAARSPEAGTQ